MSVADLLSDKAGWVVAGAIATKLVDWLLSFRRNEGERITKTYDAINAAQKQLVDGLFQQVTQLRSELNAVRQQAAADRTVALATINELRGEVDSLKAQLTL